MSGSEVGAMRCRAIIPALPLMVLLVLLLPVGAGAEDAQVNSIKETIERITGCWTPPASARPMDISVLVSFNRAGQIFGKPRITYESPDASDDDRLAYRIAVMQTLQRCTPMPFTESMAGAVAGHPFWVRFHTSGPKPAPQPKEKQAWLSPKTR